MKPESETVVPATEVLESNAQEGAVQDTVNTQQKLANSDKEVIGSHKVLDYLNLLLSEVRDDYSAALAQHFSFAQVNAFVKVTHKFIKLFEHNHFPVEGLKRIKDLHDEMTKGLDSQALENASNVVGKVLVNASGSLRISFIEFLYKYVRIEPRKAQTISFQDLMVGTENMESNEVIAKLQESLADIAKIAKEYRDKSDLQSLNNAVECFLDLMKKSQLSFKDFSVVRDALKTTIEELQSVSRNGGLEKAFLFHKYIVQLQEQLVICQDNLVIALCQHIQLASGTPINEVSTYNEEASEAAVRKALDDFYQQTSGVTSVVDGPTTGDEASDGHSDNEVVETYEQSE